MIARTANRLGVNRVVMALSTARLGDAIGNSILFIVIPLYVDTLPAPWFPFPETVRVGILISFYGLVNSLLQPLMGALGDQMGRRKPLIQGGLMLMGLGTLGFVFASRFADLLLLRALQGIGVALTVPAAMALMASATDKRTRGGSMGVYSSMRMLGFAVGPSIGGLLHDNLGFNSTFYAGAASILAGLLMVHFWVRDNPARASAGESRRFRLVDRDLLTAGILGTALATFVMASSFSMMITLEKQFNERLSATAFEFGIAFSALTVSRLLTQVPLGRASDRLGRKPLIVGGLILMAPLTVLLGDVNAIWQLTGVRLLQGFASAAIAAPAFALAADVAKAGSEGRQMSLLTMGFSLGIALGPLIAGVLAVVSFELPFWVGGLMSLMGAWVIFRHVPETVVRRVGGSGVGDGGEGDWAERPDC